MKTGEGKTLVSTLPAYLNALEEKGVHIVTVNDYLAKQDSEWMGKIYNYLGLSVGCITSELDTIERKKNKAMETQNAIVQDQVLFILGAETDRTDLIAPKELEAFSLSIAELSIKPYLLALLHVFLQQIHPRRFHLLFRYLPPLESHH